MKISEYIAALDSVMREVGDIDVQTERPWGRSDVGFPTVAYKLILQGRETKPRFWSAYTADALKGDVVCRV